LYLPGFRNIGKDLSSGRIDRSQSFAADRLNKLVVDEELKDKILV